MKEHLLRFGAHAIATVIRSLPNGKAKLWTKRNFVDRYFAWRKLRLTTRTKFGDKIDVAFPDAIQTTIFFTGEWEPCITKLVRDCLDPGDIFVDVGANIGYYSLLAASLVGPQGKVYAIEASPSIFSSLRSNVEINRSGRIHCIHKAVSNSPGMCEIFSANDKNLGHSTIIADVAKADGHTLEATVECDVLHRVVPLEDLKRARFVKIDIEGAERLAIEGIASILSTFPPNTEWLIELSPAFSPGGTIDTEWIFSAFLHAGYSAYLVENEYSDNFIYQIHHALVLTPIFSAPTAPLNDVLFSKCRTFS